MLLPLIFILINGIEKFFYEGVGIITCITDADELSIKFFGVSLEID